MITASTGSCYETAWTQKCALFDPSNTSDECYVNYNFNSCADHECVIEEEDKPMRLCAPMLSGADYWASMSELLSEVDDSDILMTKAYWDYFHFNKCEFSCDIIENADYSWI